MAKILVDYSNGHNETIDCLYKLLNQSYEGHPILFSIWWDKNAVREANELVAFPLRVDYEYNGLQSFLQYSHGWTPSMIENSWHKSEEAVDKELGISRDK
jgi:hypothetical protein